MYHELLNYFEASQQASLISFCTKEEELATIFLQQKLLSQLTS
jgi:hypothetical protein